MGYYVAGPAVGIGTFMLVFDLGQGLSKPWLMLRLVTNFSSVMTWGTIILTIFILVGLLKGFLTFTNRPAPDILTWFGVILAVGTGGYTGFLVSVINAIPFWNSGLIPVIFFVSALSTGLSVTVLLSHIFEKQPFEKGREDLTHIILIAAELIAVAAFVGIMVSGLNGSTAQKSAALIVTGKYALQFWGIFIGLGLVFPLAVYIIQHLRPQEVMVGETPGSDEIEAGEPKAERAYLAIITDSAVLAGGFALRALIIFAALPIWDGIRIP
jgi:formate-dependent nitrite reductase membrane component NrfD